MRTRLLASLLLSLALPLTAVASTLQDARVGLHIGPVQKGFPCDAAGIDQGYACDYPNGSTLNIHGDLNSGRNVYVVVLDVDPQVGVAGISMGIDYSSPDLLVLDNNDVCADLAFPAANWPDPGSGIVITWGSATNCQNTPDPSDPQGQAAAAAYALYTYAYAASYLQVIQRPIGDMALTVADCNSAESQLLVPDQAGRITFGAEGNEQFAFDPCTIYPLPVEPTSWGRLKRMYATDEP